MSKVSEWAGALTAASASWKDQWHRSSVLRVGAWVVLVIVASEGLLALRQRTQALQAEATQLHAVVLAQRTAQRESGWGARKLESQRHVQTLESMLWQAPDAALLQAGLADWVRATATRSGLNVREISAQRQVVSASGVPGVASPAQDVDIAALQKEGFTVWRVRLNVEFKRAPLLVFLQELYTHPKVVVVDRLALRLAVSGSLAEMDLRAISKTDEPGGQKP